MEGTLLIAPCFSYLTSEACICLNSYNTVLFQHGEGNRIIIKNKEQHKKRAQICIETGIQPHNY